MPTGVLTFIDLTLTIDLCFTSKLLQMLKIVLRNQNSEQFKILALNLSPAEVPERSLYSQ